MRKIKIAFVFIILFSVVFFPFHVVYADEFSGDAEDIVDYGDKVIDEIGNDSDEDANSRNCQYVFGDPTKEESVAWMLQKFFNYAKIIGPLLVLVLSGLDFAKNILISDEKEMKNATHKLVIRLLCAVGLYFVPLLTSFILNLINNSSVDQTCGIK